MTQRTAARAGFLAGLVGTLCALLLIAFFAALLGARDAEASRNGAGSYSLPSGNPVITNTKITSTWANTTLNDIASEITNSLERNGKGAMLAPLKLPNGTRTLPALTYSSETNSGLYRNAANDHRFSVNATDIQEWTNTAVVIFKPATTDSIAATATTGAGVTSVGNGANPGISATGGATGNGGTFTANGNGIGVNATGAGSGAGGTFTAGATGTGIVVSAGGGIGGDFSGGGNNVGVKGTGNGTAVGVQGLGAGTAAGGSFANGTAATGGTRQDALVVTNGDIKLDGVANPTSSTAVKNRVTPNNMIKFWGKVTGGASPSVNWGHNLSGTASCASQVVTVTLAQAMASATDWVVLADQQVGTGNAVNQLLPASTTTFTWTQYVGGAQTNLCAGSPTVTFLGIGNQ